MTLICHLWSANLSPLANTPSVWYCIPLEGFWGNTTLTLAVIMLRSSHPFYVESLHDMVWVWKITVELGTFSWADNQGAINKLYLSTPFYFIFQDSHEVSDDSVQACHRPGPLRSLPRQKQVDRAQALSFGVRSWRFSTHLAGGRGMALDWCPPVYENGRSVGRSWRGCRHCLDSVYPDFALPFSVSLPLSSPSLQETESVSALHRREFQFLSDDRKWKMTNICYDNKSSVAVIGPYFVKSDKLFKIPFRLLIHTIRTT